MKEEFVERINVRTRGQFILPCPNSFYMHGKLRVGVYTLILMQ